MTAHQRVIASSHSSINMFDTCAHQYEARYVIEDTKFVQGPEAAWGDYVHQCLEVYVRDGVPLPTNVAHYWKYAEAVRRRKGEKVLEGQFAIRFDLVPTTYFGSDVWLRAKIDVLILRTAEGIAEILDWKTGKMKGDITQLALYALMVMCTYPAIEEVRAGYVWLKDGVVTTPVIYRRSDMQGIAKLFAGKHERIVQAYDSGIFPPKPSGLCNGWCDVTRCQFWKPKRNKT